MNVFAPLFPYIGRYSSASSHPSRPKPQHGTKIFRKTPWVGPGLEALETSGDSWRVLDYLKSQAERRSDVEVGIEGVTLNPNRK